MQYHWRFLEIKPYSEFLSNWKNFTDTNNIKRKHLYSIPILNWNTMNMYIFPPDHRAASWPLVQMAPKAPSVNWAVELLFSLGWNEFRVQTGGFKPGRLDSVAPVLPMYHNLCTDNAKALHFWQQSYCGKIYLFYR